MTAKMSLHYYLFVCKCLALQGPMISASLPRRHHVHALSIGLLQLLQLRKNIGFNFYFDRELSILLFLFIDHTVAGSNYLQSIIFSWRTKTPPNEASLLAWQRWSCRKKVNPFGWTYEVLTESELSLLAWTASPACSHHKKDRNCSYRSNFWFPR